MLLKSFVCEGQLVQKKGIIKGGLGKEMKWLISDRG